jgi:hypothetical protein
MRTEIAEERGTDEVGRWRREQLVQSGFAPQLAKQVARDRRYDLHALIELVERGCDPRVAVRIFAPLEEDAA